MNEETQKLKRGIFNVLIANLINLVINIITNFVLPKYLSVDSYAAIKTYQLYSAYLGVLSLGYVDGMFLKYGGIDFKDIDKSELNVNISSFRIFQLIIVVILLIVGFIIKDDIYIAFTLSILPVNMAGYYKSLYQSIGEFKKYSKIMNLTTISMFFINFLVLVIFKSDNYIFYIIGYIIFYFIIWLYLEYYFKKCVNIKLSYNIFKIKEVILNIKSGILLMLGNFSNIILTGMDRWLIKIFMTTSDFAQYSFACSMENFVNVAVTPITITLYNYFCKIKDDVKQIRFIRNLIIIFASYIIACAFPGKFILEIYLQEYLEASEVMFYLFDAQMFYIIIKSIYVNLYKSEKKQNKYFIKLIIVIIIGFLLNLICFKIMKNKEAFAIGTLLSSIIWLIISINDFKYLKYSFNEIIYIIIASVTFIIYGYTFNAIIGFILYLITIFITGCIFLRNDMLKIIQMILGKLERIRN